MNPEQIVQSIKNIAKGIHERSYKMTKQYEFFIIVEQLTS
jgi:hypothetical protein